MRIFIFFFSSPSQTQAVVSQSDEFGSMMKTLELEEYERYERTLSPCSSTDTHYARSKLTLKLLDCEKKCFTSFLSSSDSVERQQARLHTVRQMWVNSNAHMPLTRTISHAGSCQTEDSRISAIRRTKHGRKNRNCLTASRIAISHNYQQEGSSWDFVCLLCSKRNRHFLVSLGLKIVRKIISNHVVSF